MVDVFDQAQAHEQRLRDAALERALDKSRPASPHGEGSAECARCGGEIPAAHPKALTCVPCQEVLERGMGR